MRSRLHALEANAAPAGWLRIAAPLLFSQLALGRLMAEFRQRFPQIHIEVVSENRMSDLVEEQFDVAIRINPQANSSLVGRCFARDKLVLVATPSVSLPAADGQSVPTIPAVVMSTHIEGSDWIVENGQRRCNPQPRIRSLRGDLS